MVGEANPNFGKRHPNMWTMPLELRGRLSRERLGEGNPNWSGGSPGNGRYRMQTTAVRWARKHLGTTCETCGADGAALHHVVARRRFRHPLMAHFRQNLVMLCPAHHGEADRLARAAIRSRAPHDLPYGGRLPEPILAQLARDGSVSWLPSACDLSTIGLGPGQAIPDSWLSDTAESPGETAPRA